MTYRFDDEEKRSRTECGSGGEGSVLVRRMKHRRGTNLCVQTDTLCVREKKEAVKYLI